MARKTAATPKRKEKPKLTAADRHKRFVAMAHEVDADERPETFERVFKTVVSQKEAKGIR